MQCLSRFSFYVVIYLPGYVYIINAYFPAPNEVSHEPIHHNSYQRIDLLRLQQRRVAILRFKRHLRQKGKDLLKATLRL